MDRARDLTLEAVVIPVRGVQPILATASFWGAALGGALAVPRATRPIGAALLMLIGYGGVGVAWERTCRCDLRQLQRPPRIAMSGLATHLPLALVGHVLLRSVRNARSEKTMGSTGNKTP